MITVNELRKKFLDYFAYKGHKIVRSSSLVPHGDQTLLFTNAGMNQFKDVFLGLEQRDYVRATSSQKCVRAGGKHNDLENVGYTARHHTFFEMLGNFSFGDYFKQDAIKFAWEFLTDTQIGLNLEKDKLYVTVYHTDDEAYNIWHKEIGLAEARIIRIGDKLSGGSDNFWQMGETGPCGPCTEIFYDHGAEIPGGLPGSPDEEGDRYIEIWNCVFMQFNRDENGVLHNLPKPSVDTGMGLERIAAVMQGVHSNYEIDLFAKLIKEAANITGHKSQYENLQMRHPGVGRDPVDNLEEKFYTQVIPSLRVIADHIRSISFLIADGVLPSNEGRGYVLRRIIRRAIRHGYKLMMRTPFLYKLVATLVEEMGEAYPELKQTQAIIEDNIKSEEERFFQTIDKGMKILNSEVLKIAGKTSLKNKACVIDGDENFIDTLSQLLPAEKNEMLQHKLSGDVAFKLYDTYGFPLDLVQDICRDVLPVDLPAFDKAMEKQKNQARESGKFKMDKALEYNDCDTNFSGYTDASVEAKVVALYADGLRVDKLNNGESGIIVLDQTVFYAESGGQVGDSGVIQVDGGIGCIFKVDDTQKIRPQVFGHVGAIAHGSLKVGDVVTATIDLHKRLGSARNHSATHLLHKALREVLGTHVVQKGSLVCDGYTRFDFAHNAGLTKDEVAEVERIVNHVIMMNYEVVIANLSYDDALKSGAMALFGEKYADEVRVVKMGEFSSELCGGTHVRRTGDIGFFTITSESGIANGIRRIEAVTGEIALVRMQKNMQILDSLRLDLKAQTNDIIKLKVADLQAENRDLAKQITALKITIAVVESDKLYQRLETLSNGVKFLCLEVPNKSNDDMVLLIDQLKMKLEDGAIVLVSSNNGKVNIVVSVAKTLTGSYHAGKIVTILSQVVGGKGGGRPDFAVGGGADANKIADLISCAREIFI